MKCKGCGVEIQTKDPSLPGFVPEHVFAEKLENNEPILCQRCFKSAHYKQLLPVSVDSNFLKDFDKVIRNFKNVIWIVDIIDFEGTFQPWIAKKLRGKNVFLVVNKVDLLPKSVAFAELKEWVKRRLKNYLRIEKENIRLISAKKDFGINALLKLLKRKKIDKVVVIGITNVGKSSLVNQLTGSNITISSYPGTTLGILRKKVQGIEIFDTPGIEVKNRVSDIFDVYTQESMIPSREISRKTFKPQPQRVVFISAVFRFKILDFARNNLRPVFLVFASNNVAIHDTKEERVQELLEKRIGTVLYPPYDSNYKLNINFKEEIFEVEEGYDLAIPGLGWIAVRRGPLKIEVVYPENVKLIIRESLVGKVRGR